MNAPAIDYRDLQGLVRFGYKHLRAARYLLLRVRDREAAPGVAAPGAGDQRRVQRAAAADGAARRVQRARGSRRSGCRQQCGPDFSPEFLGGMTEPSRTRRLGDHGANAPERWQWGGAAGVPHVLVMFFAEPGRLDAFEAAARPAPTWQAAFEVQRRLETSDLDGVEPFGFLDGISQPWIDWAQASDPATRVLDYSNVSALGEFVLGYRNEYGKYTDRPVVGADASSAALPDALDDRRQEGRRPQRHLPGDPAARPGRARRSGSSSIAPAAAMRPRHGSWPRPSSAARRRAIPWCRSTAQPIPGTGSQPEQLRQNQFTFDGDPRGVTCPFGAHIRRSNPRNTDYPGRPTGLKKLLAALGALEQGLPRRPDLAGPLPPHPAARPRVRAAAVTRPRRWRRRADPNPSAGSTSSASTPTSAGSSSSCRTRGWPTPLSPTCAARPIRSSAPASRRPAARPPASSPGRDRAARPNASPACRSS